MFSYLTNTEFFLPKNLELALQLLHYLSLLVHR